LTISGRNPPSPVNCNWPASILANTSSNTPEARNASTASAPEIGSSALTAIDTAPFIRSHSYTNHLTRPNGTIILTAPTGHTYVSQAHGAALFPTLAQSTGELPTAPAFARPDTDRSVMMPRRNQTRDQHRRDRINAERRQRTQLIAQEEQQRQAWLTANYQPPPF
jgi:hypothetical protein